MRVERELMRGAGPVAVLKLLESRSMYGYELIQAIATQSDGVLTMGQSTLYPLLYNLEAQGFVSSQWQQTQSGRRRKYYALTAKGERRLAADSAQWQSVAQAMRGLGILPDPQVPPVAAEGAAS